MRAMAWVLVLGTACSGGGLGSPSTSSAGNGSCVPGSKSCPCYPNQSCDGSLTCVSEVCVDLGGGGAAGGGNGAAGTTAGGGASGSGPTSTGGTNVATGGRSSGGRSTGGTPSGGTPSGGSPTGGTGVGQPACGTTSAGTSIAKGVACASSDPQLCYKTCGPINVGFKSETCTGGAYAEGDCTFPSGVSYTCFRVPTADAAGCPSTPPQHNQPCSVALCSVPCGTTPCEMCGVAGGYLDSGGSAKAGYCVCIADAAVGSKWSCASTPSAWPCPGGQGC